MTIWLREENTSQGLGEKKIALTFIEICVAFLGEQKKILENIQYSKNTSFFLQAISFNAIMNRPSLQKGANRITSKKIVRSFPGVATKSLLIIEFFRVAPA